MSGILVFEDRLVLKFVRWSAALGMLIAVSSFLFSIVTGDARLNADEAVWVQMLTACAALAGVGVMSGFLGLLVFGATAPLVAWYLYFRVQRGFGRFEAAATIVALLSAVLATLVLLFYDRKLGLIATAAWLMFFVIKAAATPFLAWYSYLRVRRGLSRFEAVMAVVGLLSVALAALWLVVHFFGAGWILASMALAYGILLTVGIVTAPYQLYQERKARSKLNVVDVAPRSGNDLIAK